MSGTRGTEVLPPHRSGRTRRRHRLATAGLVAPPAAMVTTTLTAAVARAAGVGFEIPDGGESIPLPGFALVTGFFSVVGIAVAVGLLRWSAHPARRFVQTTVALTAISLAPPLLVGADAASTGALLGLHLVAASVVIPALTRSLSNRPD